MSSGALYTFSAKVSTICRKIYLEGGHAKDEGLLATSGVTPLLVKLENVTAEPGAGEEGKGCQSVKTGK